MKYEVKGPSLAQAVAMSVQSAKIPLCKKSSTTIYANAGGSYETTTLDVYVERGRSYTISWSAHNDAGEGADYGIRIFHMMGMEATEKHSIVRGARPSLPIRLEQLVFQ